MIFQIAGLDFQGALYTLDQMGLRDFILPFVLLFTIVFAVLEKTGIFKQRKYNSLIALAMALIVVIPHALGQYPPGGDVVQMINDALPGVAIWIVMIISFIILIGIFAPGNIRLFSAMYGNWITIVALVVVGYIFGASAGWWATPSQASFLADSQTQALIIIIAVFAVIIGWITSEETPAADRTAWETHRRERLSTLEEAEISREERIAASAAAAQRRQQGGG